MALETIAEVKKWLKDVIIVKYFSHFKFEKLSDNQFIAFTENKTSLKKCFGISLSRKSNNLHIVGIVLKLRLNKFEDYYDSECQHYGRREEFIEVYSLRSDIPTAFWPIGYSIDLHTDESVELLMNKIEKYIKTYDYIFTKYNTLYDLHNECNDFGDNLSLYIPYGEHFKHIYVKYFCNDNSYKTFGELVIEKKNKSISDYPVDSTDIYMLGWKREVEAIKDLLQRIERGELKHLVGTF